MKIIAKVTFFLLLIMHFSTFFLQTTVYLGMSFIKSFFASFLAVLTAFLIGIPILLMVIGGIIASVSSRGEAPLDLKPNSILHLKLSGQIVEDATPEPIQFDLSNILPLPYSTSTNRIGMYQLINALEHARDDEQIAGIYLDLSPLLQTGWSNLSRIREALVDFKTSDKFIYAYSEVYTEKSYYLASTADKVHMPAQGRLEFNGFASTRMYYKSMFDKVGITPQVFRVGTYKSAVEPYLRDDMSKEAREQTEVYLNDLWQIFAEDISTARGLPLSKINQLAETFMIGSGRQALEDRLVDAVSFEDDVLSLLAEESESDKVEDIPLVKMNAYLNQYGNQKSGKSDKIAVIFAEGVIQSGKSNDGVIGSETVVEALRKAREDKNVKAIVLRVNSPGGSALASSVMAHEIEKCTAQKPVIASMGDYAASGGYYISAPCDKIFAQPNTITGSIGIFSVFFEVNDLLKENLGLSPQQAFTHENANLGMPYFPMTPAAIAYFQKDIERGYNDFLTVVENGRNMERPDVEKVAQGRVWTGSRALKAGLVDQLGGLNQAIAFAAETTGLEEDSYRVKRFSTPDDPFANLLKDAMSTQIGQADLLARELNNLQKFRNHFPGPGTYMLMPYEINIQ
ncbi:MAG: signal peptide peptidase SppA [Bacteroidota bacterium]